MKSLSIVVMSQIKHIPTPSWLVYFVLKAQPYFINFGWPYYMKQFKSLKLERFFVEILTVKFCIYNIFIF